MNLQSSSDGVPRGERRFCVRRSGFSLLELLIVLSVVSVLMTIVMPRIDVVRFQVNSAIHEIGSAVAASRGQAIMRQHDFVLMFDEDRDRFLVLNDENNNKQADAGEETRTVQLTEGVTFGRGGASPIMDMTDAISFTKLVDQLPALTFHRNGAASEEGVIYITSVRAAGGEGNTQDSRALRIERATGRVRCFNYRYSAWQEGC